MINVVLIALGFILIGIPFLIGILLRILIKRSSAWAVALFAALLVFAAQLPWALVSGIHSSINLSQTGMSKNSIAAARLLEIVVWIFVGIGLPFVFARGGTELMDKLRKRKNNPNQPPERTG